MKHFLNPSEVDPKEFYKILVSAILPRPIAWVSTVSTSGVDNLAPFSFFTVASSKPPVLCFAPALKSINGVPTEKDTLKNIRETNEFVVNIVSRSLVEKMNQTSFEYPETISEFDATCLTKEPSNLVKPKRVGESLVNFECKLFQLIEIGKEVQGGTLILGEIVATHLDTGVFVNGKIEIDLLDPVGRLGGLWYSGVGDRFELKRPTEG